MVDINLKGIGEVIIERSRVKTNDFNMNGDDFIRKYGTYFSSVPGGDLNSIKDAIRSQGKNQKIKAEDDVIAAFQKLAADLNKPQSSQSAPARRSGFGADEHEEARQAEELKQQTHETGKVDVQDGQETKNTSGEVTGKIELEKDSVDEGLLVKTEIQENILIKYNFNEEKPIKDNEEPLKGKVIIENPSKNNKISAIHMTLEETDKTDIEDPEFYHRELPPEQKVEKEYTIVGDRTPTLKIKEFISTINDEAVESYALANAKENTIYFKTEVENISQEDILNLVFLKEVHNSFEDPNIEQADLGEATFESGEKIYFVNMPDPSEASSEQEEGEEQEEEIEAPPSEEEEQEEEQQDDEFNKFDAEDDEEQQEEEEEQQEEQEGEEDGEKDEEEKLDDDEEVGQAADDVKGAIVWKIEKLEPGQKATLVYRIVMNVEDKSVSVRTGRVKAKYAMKSSLSGLKIKDFDAVTDHRLGIQVEQNETDPLKYSCEVSFKNNSDFTMNLVNCDVYDFDDESIKYMDIDPADKIFLPAKARWDSVPFEVETENEEGPLFTEEFKFLLLRSEEINAMNKIQVNDVKLAVASLTGTIAYDRTEIPSYVQVEMTSTLTATNDGGAPFNELKMQQFLKQGFLPPEADKIELKFNDDVVEVDASWVEVMDHTDEETGEAGQIISINITDIKEKFGKFFEPEDTFTAVYPVTADKVEKDVQFFAWAKYIGETYPKGQPIEYIVEEKFEIKTVHERKKISKFKDVIATEDEGVWEIVLIRENRGNTTVKELKIRDYVPNGFTHGKYSEKNPEVGDDEGGNMLTWTVKDVKPDSTVEIRYTITGEAEDYDPKLLSIQY